MVATDLWQVAAPAAGHAVFEELYGRCKGPLYNYIYRLVGDAALADDLMQESFLKVYRALDRLPAGAGSTPWLYRVATNTCYDALRRRRLLSWLPWSHIAETAAPLSAALEGVTEAHEEVARALALVPARLRAPLLLHAVHGFSYADIAATLGVSEAAVKMRVSRARTAFRRVYRAGDEEPQS